MGGVSSKWRGCESSLVSTIKSEDGGCMNEPTHTERKCITYPQVRGSRFLLVVKDGQRNWPGRRGRIC